MDNLRKEWSAIVLTSRTPEEGEALKSGERDGFSVQSGSVWWFDLSFVQLYMCYLVFRTSDLPREGIHSPEMRYLGCRRSGNFHRLWCG